MFECIEANHCQCYGHCPNNEPNGTCSLKTGGFCFAAVEQVFNKETNSLELERTLGCLASEDEGSLLQVCHIWYHSFDYVTNWWHFQCKGHLVPHEVPKSIICCNEEDFCNRNLYPNHFNIPPKDPNGIQLRLKVNLFWHYIYLTEELNPFWFSPEFYVSIMTSFIIVLIFLAILYFVFKRYKRFPFFRLFSII